MKTLKDRKFKLLLISALLTIQEISIPQLTSSAFGADTKKVGRTNASATVNTILSGKGAPAASLGNNGDFYIDKVNMNFYGPKTKDLWPLPVSMRGPVGPSGIDGKNGNDGKPGTTTVAAGGGGASTPGPQGPAGPKGDAGDVGPQGPAGSAGPAGATGASGATGPAGPQGLQGPAGPTGPTGPAGDQGIQGIPGVANNPVKIIDLKFGGVTPYSISLGSGVGVNADPAGALTAGNSYKFIIVLNMRSVGNLFSNNSFAGYIDSDIAGLNPNYLTSFGVAKYYDASILENKYQASFVFTGGITIPAGGPSVNIRTYFKDMNGFTATNGGSLSGKAFFEQVSSVS